VLFLHGFGESPMVAEVSADPLKSALEGGGAKFLPIPAGFKKLSTPDEMAAIGDPEYRQTCMDGALDAYAWYPLVKGNEGGHRAPPAEDFAFRASPADTAEAVKQLKAMIEKANGVDAIMGFSQGGEMCYYMAEALDTLLPDHKKQLKFVATFGSEDSFLQRGKEPTSISSQLHFFICYGDGDADAVADSQTAAASLKKAGAGGVTTHKVAGLGHAMPKDAAVYKAMVDAFKGALSAKPPEPEKPKAVPMPMKLPPKPPGWGSAHFRPWDPEREPIVPLETLKKRFDTIRDGSEQEKRDAIAAIINYSMNNDICSDFHHVEGAIDLLKHLASGKDSSGTYTAAPGILARMGFKEFDRNLNEPLIPPRLRAQQQAQAATGA